MLAFAFAPATALAAVEAAVDRAVVGEGESFELRLKVTGDDAGAEPEPGPLEQDFDVAGSRRSSQLSIVNGRMERSRSWVLTLIPKGTGELTIPALEVGDATTRPLTVTVRPAGSAPGDDGAADVFLEVEAEPRDPYVQAQVSYRVRIFFQDLSEGELADPEVEGAVVARHGEDVAYDATRHGRRYRVLERRYVLFPQRSGTLEIPAPVFVGRVPDGAGPRSPFGSFGAFDQMFQGARTIRRRGEAVTLEVRPAPPAFPGADWLPATDLALGQEWSDGAATVRVGEPLTRTIVVEARGLEAAQLPELGPPAGEGYRAYADQPQLETGAEGPHVVSRRRESHAIIPSRPGKLRLPPVEVQWWSTRDDGPRTATLPGRTVEVRPAADATGTAPPPPATEPQPAPPPGVESVDAPAPHGAMGPWPVIAALLLAAWLVTLYLLVRQRRRNPAAPTSAAPPATDAGAPSPASAIRALERACRRREPRGARDALLAWGRDRWPQAPPANLGQLAARLGPGELARLTAELDRVLYGGPAAPASPPELWERLPAVLRAWRVPPSDAATSAPLPELYPGANFIDRSAE